MSTLSAVSERNACDGPTDVVESTICASPKLQALELEISGLLADRSKGATEQTRAGLSRSSVVWREGRFLLCFATDDAGDYIANPPSCLASLISNQIRELQNPIADVSISYWSAGTRTASGITGDILLSETAIVFSGGGMHRLRFLKNLDGPLKWLSIMSDRSENRLYAIENQDPRVVWYPNTLCGRTEEDAPTYMISATSMHELQGNLASSSQIGPLRLDIAFFKGHEEPKDFETSRALCGTFGYYSTIP